MNNHLIFEDLCYAGPYFKCLRCMNLHNPKRQDAVIFNTKTWRDCTYDTANNGRAGFELKSCGSYIHHCVVLIEWVKGNCCSQHCCLYSYCHFRVLSFPYHRPGEKEILKSVVCSNLTKSNLIFISLCSIKIKQSPKQKGCVCDY